MLQNGKSQAELLQQFGSTCGYCGKNISEDTVVIWSRARVRPGTDLSEFEGQILELRLLTADRVVLGVVPTFDSEAKRQGYDLLFIACSEKCGARLKRAMKRDIELGNLLGFPQLGE